MRFKRKVILKLIEYNNEIRFDLRIEVEIII